MNETYLLLVSAIAGVLIGTMFFGGLWLTVRRGLTSPYAALWFIGSLLLRMSIALTGFYFIGRHHWQHLLACLLGFIIARAIVMRLTGSRSQNPTASATEVQNAS